MAVPAMLEHGRDARGTKSSRVPKNLGIRNTEAHSDVIKRPSPLRLSASVVKIFFSDPERLV